MTSLAELRQRLLHRYYVIHLIYGCTFIVFSVKRLLFSNNNDITDAEVNAHIALVLFSVWKSLMANTAEELASVLILYTKFFTFCMIYWKYGMFKTILYLGGWIVLSTLFPQPWYQGPTKIVELSETKFREDVQRRKRQTATPPTDGPRITEITDENEEGGAMSTSSSTTTTTATNNNKKDKGKGKAIPTNQYTRYWVVMLYANWSLACLNFEAVLAKLSLQYSADHIKFGKIDIDVYTDLADEYGISRDPASFDLPTLLLFRDGAQIRRLPELTPTTDDTNKNKATAATTAKDTITRIGWSKKAATVVKAFHLDKIFIEK
ncbi:hypothetical protein BDA99DRAFT_498727 [Phascolomyces articulosus]|uniref:Thioredoxin domain-containing protein n=1 Tax=Phascolomyces articulosus TaxID=60185 RepID=A0AAD5KSM3_9FUNG|nr:hypothetical protein BDA99DRAFT_498727 [Phascolomyces articulosus]